MIIRLLESWLERRRGAAAPPGVGSGGRDGTVPIQSRTFFATALFCIWAACMLVLVFPLHKPAPEDLTRFGKAPYTVYAEFDFKFKNKAQTEQAGQQAWRNEPLVYRLDRSACEATLRQLNDFFARLEQPLLPEASTLATEDVVGSVFASLTAGDLAALPLATIPDKWELLLETMERALYVGILPADERLNRPGEHLRVYKNNSIREQARSLTLVPTPVEAADQVGEAVTRDLPSPGRETLHLVLRRVLAELIRPTLVFDSATTEQNRLKAKVAIKPVISEMRKGDIVIGGGESLEQETLECYRAYFKEREQRRGFEHFGRLVLGSAMLCFLLMILTGIYLAHIHPEVVRSHQKMWLTATVVVVAVMVNYLVIGLFQRLAPTYQLPPAMVTALLPVAMASILLSVLIGLRVALYAGLFVSLIAALQLDNSFQVVLNGLVVSGIAGFTVRHVLNHRAFYLRSALAISLTVPTMEAIHLWSYQGTLEAVPWILGFGLANGMLTAGASLVLLFFLETVFQINTDMSLLLLCDYNHPLLKRLQFEAPGTYHHSLMVSSLAEPAAQAIGANAIRARVGALFHDIGKLSQPGYFVENAQAEDRHAQLNPRLSSGIILNHVHEGMELAAKYKLRRVIRDAIEQHHGTDLVQFFYHRAIEEERGKEGEVVASDYRYPGPLPRVREVVIISLADACEAASRSLEKPTPQAIEHLVGEIFRKRIRAGQLDAAELTFGELAKVRESFVKTLATMLHGRIIYPKDEAEESGNEDDLFLAAKNPAPAERAAPPSPGDCGG